MAGELLQAKITFKNFGGLNQVVSNVTNAMFQSVTKAAQSLFVYVRTQYLRGGSQGLKQRSGKLYRNTYMIPATLAGNVVVGGVRIGEGLVYTPVHVGPIGQVMTIVPKKAGALAIPLTAKAKLISESGVALRSLGTLFRGGRGNRLSPDILYERKDKRAQAMFVLRRSVKLSTKVFPEKIAAEQEQVVTDEVMQEMMRLLSLR